MGHFVQVTLSRTDTYASELTHYFHRRPSIQAVQPSSQLLPNSADQEDTVKR
jgi:hypothetical protein